jgi:hypothetical protein
MFSVRMTEHNPKEGELTMDTKGFTFATTEDVKKLSLTRAEKDRYSPNYVRHYKINHVVNAFEHPFDDNLTEKLGFSDSFKVEPCVVAPNEHHHYYEYNYNAVNQREWKLKKGMVDNFKKLPMFLLVQLSSWQTKVKTPKMTEKLEALAATARNPVFMGEAGGERWNSYYHNDHLGSANVIVEVEYNGSYIPMAVSFAVAEKVFGLEVTDDMKLRISSGAECEFTGWKEMFENLNGYRRSWRDKVEKFDFTYASLHSVESKIGCGKKNLGRLLKALLKSKAWILEQPGKLSGIKKTWLRLEPVMNEVLEENPMALVAYRSFAYECARAIDGVKVSAVFNDIFDKVNTKEEFVKALKDFYAGKDRDEDGDLMDANSKLEASVKRLDVYKARRKEILKSQANRAFAKIQEEAENLTIDKKKHKLTWAKIEAGELALGVFFRKSEQYFLLNDNWDLWEEMFKRGYGDQAIELANEVKGRSTYEKDLMSYFYFVLHGLPEYLKKQTGEKWTCIPKLVNSADELEPPKEDSGGVARKRSALTPQVDNEAKTVVVPYASLAISGGFGTTYCYSHDYHVLTKGYSLGGYAVTKDVEEKLNGRDKYGLMFYTLVGSVQGRGYPTFLIIFENRTQKGGIHVHFHRTHPFRSKDGDYNPIHNWVKGCYNWMAGNVKMGNIKAQQGDLFFVKVAESATDGEEDENLKVVKNLDFTQHKVNQYDNHRFEREVAFAEYTKAAKSNILGYVKLEQDTWLNHHEHDNVLIPKGTYAIHQCRSWEANPKGVWSLRID